MKAMELIILGLVLGGFLAGCFWEVSWLVRRFKSGRNREIAGRRFYKMEWGIHGWVIAGIAFLIYSHFIEPYWLTATPVELKTENLKKTSLRIVHFSDLHSETAPRCETQLVKRVNDLAPDVIVFTGDCINAAEALPLFAQTLGRLQARIGKFAIRGDWDRKHWRGLNLFAGTGFRELEHETIPLTKDGETFFLTGLGSDYGLDSLEEMKTVPRDAYHIFMHHCPMFMDGISKRNVNLYLTGDTHGGQVAIPFYGALTIFSHHPKTYEAGLYSCGKMVAYINRGIGMAGGWMPKLRFRCRPEITMLDIKPAARVSQH